MSLFGGESTHSTETSDTESDQLPEHRSSLPIVEPASPSIAQDPNLMADSDVSEGNSTDRAEDTADPGEDHPFRPNRFTGPPQTWKGYTAADRQVVTSLEQLRDTDLAAHLYNAHALKQRARRPLEELAGLKDWQSRDTWLRKGDGLRFTDESGLEQNELIPSKDWTAWPLPPTEQFLAYEGAQAKGAPGEWEIGGEQVQDAGLELRDEIMAVFLRIAKENWNSKETDIPDLCGRERIAASFDRSRSESARSPEPHRSVSQVNTKIKNGDNDEKDHVSVEEGPEEKTSGKKRGRKAQTEVPVKPRILSDDAKAYRLLQPSINSMLGRLDELAMAVRRTRLNHIGHGELDDRSSQSDLSSGAESTDLESESASQTSSCRQSRETSRGRPLSRTTSSRKGRQIKKDVHGRLGHRQGTDNDSVLDDPSDTENFREPGTRKRARSTSSSSVDSGSATRDRARAGLIDWSEVLGLAAVKGWDERALARTAQRCASLFGEDMSFIPLDADLPAKHVPEPIRFTPSAIPSPEAASVLGSVAEKRPLFQVGTLRCPHRDCFGYTTGFALPYRVVEHCMRVHGYDPRTNDANNEARAVGGVQIDGFLQPVTVKPGWMGSGRLKDGNMSKKLKVLGAEEETDSDVIESVEH